MPAKKNLVGERFGLLKVLHDIPRSAKTNNRRVMCQCDCGGSIAARVDRLRSGRAKSCGCLAYSSGISRVIKARVLAGSTIPIEEQQQAEAENMDAFLALLTDFDQHSFVPSTAPCKNEIDALRRKLYGMVPGQYEQMLSTQGGVCAICHGVNKKGALAVDHCHTTGRVRGLLCRNCNTGIGLLGDSAESVSRAFVYLVTASRKSSSSQ